MTNEEESILYMLHLKKIKSLKTSSLDVYKELEILGCFSSFVIFMLLWVSTCFSVD